ncbi:hypothetical protein MGYG_04088 [Nannizzia gypsea CBS 118893]|uniref:Uncharacterized protein n=1 Tax=Arthroderma gypseum (strain ATCC MYA-4604 / CBS 118893) TaxID=535722 RepID=E4UUW8_ARTGP|nr:hypothetical protein MGYG_04088 [Nannizzia gypsea CBS 118893]EFR01085.1 hypothetical protein MGYG_04088 [Nannizzia gypsea CBS 118893]
MSIQHPRHTPSCSITQAACLTMLPNELILLISNDLTRKQDLNSFLRCNHRFYNLLNQQLYRLDAQSPRNDAIWWAVKTADVELAKRAIDAGSDPNKKCESGGWVRHRPLYVAVFQAKNTHKRKFVHEGEAPDFLQKNDHLIRYLVSRNADVNCLDNYEKSPLRLAVFNGEITSVRVFLDNGGDATMQDYHGHGLANLVVGRAQSDGPNGLIYLEILKLLLESGLNPKNGGRDKFTPLHQQMSAVGGKIRRENRTGCRTLSEERVEDVLKLLLKYGADIDAQDEFGQTPLSLALLCLPREPICLKLLLQCGADTSLFTLPPAGEKRDAAIKACHEVSQKTGRIFEFLTE